MSVGAPAPWRTHNNNPESAYIVDTTGRHVCTLPGVSSAASDEDRARVAHIRDVILAAGKDVDSHA